MLRRFALLLPVLLVLTLLLPVRAQDNACALPPRLVVGEEGRVLIGQTVNLRAAPGLHGERLARLPEAAMFTVLEGGSCADGYVWWRVDYHHAVDARVGWVAEGTVTDGAPDYWLEPRGTRLMRAADVGMPIYDVQLSDGFVEPEGCLAPPDDYTRVQVGYATLNARTLFMLDHAERLYRFWGGLLDFRASITQGSYTTAEPASFGTHSGGGAVDLSVRSRVDFSIMVGDIEPIIRALRIAGFAAWLRDTGILYPDSPIHIHAIAIGDTDLSPDARLQIDGDGGYLRGLDGLPPEWGGPHPDAHGGPVICRWMVDAGFDDLRR